jgi:hypothetical protein
MGRRCEMPSGSGGSEPSPDRDLAQQIDRRLTWRHPLGDLLAEGADIRPLPSTFDTYAERWLVAQVHRPSTAASVASNLKNHLSPTFGSRPLGSVRPTEVQGWVRQLSETLAPGTIEGCYRLFSTIYRAAVADRVVATSPCVG